MFNKNIHILLVDDDELDIKIVQRMLQEHFQGHFLFSKTSRLSEAKKIIKTVDVVVLDLWLPDSAGVETISQLYEELSHVPFVVLSGNEDPILFRQCVEMGAHDYLVKDQISGFDFCRSLQSAIIRKEFELKLLQSSENKSLFLAQMSHEIRTPLHLLLSLIGVLKEDLYCNAEQRHYLKLMEGAGDALFAIVNDILDLSKAELGKLEVEKSEFNLKFFIQNIYEIFKIKASIKNIQFFLHLDESLPVQVMGDSNRIRQVLFNLIGNAVKFTDQGRVMLEVKVFEKNKNLISFCVTDTGPGISKKVIPVLFQPYEQGELETAYRQKGTGLGLFIAKKLVEKMGGVITVKSPLPSEESGSQFCFQLPLEPVAEKEKRENVPKKESVSKLEDFIPYFQGKHVLVADDSHGSLLFYRSFFKKLHVSVDWAENGKEAVALFCQKTYDLVLLDYQMPQMTGFQAVVLMRAEEKKQQRNPARIISLSGDAREEVQKEAASLGFNAFVIKPIRLIPFLKLLVFPS